MLLLRRDGSDSGVRHARDWYNIVGAVVVAADADFPCGAWKPPAMGCRDPLVSLRVTAETMHSLLSGQIGETEETSFPL